MKNRIFMEFLGKLGIERILLNPVTVNFVKLWTSLGYYVLIVYLGNVG
jgi:hypothetical protein